MKKKTLVVQTFIMQLAVVIQMTLFFELFRAMVEGQALFIVVTILILLVQLLINVAFSVTFRVQIDDYKFNEYIEKHKKSHKIIMLLCTVVNLHLFRLFYSKFYKSDAFHAAATTPAQFVRPINLYSKLYLAAVGVPVFIMNLLGSLMTFSGFWDNQLQMTMFESCLLIPLIAIFIFVETRQSPRMLLHRLSEEDSFFVGLFKDESMNRVLVRNPCAEEVAPDSSATKKRRKGVSRGAGKSANRKRPVPV